MALSADDSRTSAEKGSGLLATAYESLALTRVRWAILRTSGVDAQRREDVELLVAPEDIERAIRQLRGHGFVQMEPWSVESRTFLLGYDRPTDAWTRLVLVSSLFWGQKSWRLGDPSSVLSRCRRVGSHSLLAPDDEFWVLLLHCLLDEKRPSSHALARMQQLKDAADTRGELASRIQALCPPGIDVADMARSAGRGEYARLRQQGAELAGVLRRQQSLAHREPARDWLVRQAAKQAWIWRRGISVALLAPDGAGKSSLIEALRETFCVAVTAVYMGMYRSDARGERRERHPGLVLRLVRQWRRYARARLHQAQGRVVLFDRYTYDALLPAPRSPTIPRRVRRWLLAHACPPPDLAILLDVPAEVMFERKGEHSVAYLDERRRSYLALAKRNPEIRVIDADRDFDAVRREVTCLIWERLASKLARP